MKKSQLLFVLMGCLLAPAFANGQFYSQAPSVPISAATAPYTGDLIDETGGGVSVHTLSWTLTGAPTQCLIAIESADDAKGKFVPMGPVEDCTHEGSITRSGITVKFVRINISAFAGDEKASITYIYGGMGTVGSAAFASANLWAKLDALRAVEALKHGITKVNHCPMFVPGPGADAVPYPTYQEFQLYHEQFGSSLILAGLATLAQMGFHPRKIRFKLSHSPRFDLNRAITFTTGRNAFPIDLHSVLAGLLDSLQLWLWRICRLPQPLSRFPTTDLCSRTLSDGV